MTEMKLSTIQNQTHKHKEKTSCCQGWGRSDGKGHWD